MNFLHTSLLVTVVAAAAAVTIPKLPSAQRPAEVPPVIEQPTPPEPMYEELQVLMANGVMPNYRAVWSACERGDRDGLQQALRNISELTGRLDKYVPPRNAADLEHYARHMREVHVDSAALSILAGQADRATVTREINRIYRSCQSCHEEYAPPQRQPLRELSMPR